MWLSKKYSILHFIHKMVPLSLLNSNICFESVEHPVIVFSVDREKKIF